MRAAAAAFGAWLDRMPLWIAVGAVVTLMAAVAIVVGGL